ncbi:hypothetical protein [Psychrobacter vallis]|uniref:hypothetical protein n=1 Tax=Psychrobacter vallis TaxID=248451 RepID=UPI0019194A08|nr:hypothetical protein [Psychrobacter vallis]
MDKSLVEQLAFASGLEHKQLEDGSMGFRPYIHDFANAIEAEVYRDIELHQRKDWQDIMALRLKVTEQASEMVNLRRLIGGARDILNKEILDG